VREIRGAYFRVSDGTFMKRRMRSGARKTIVLLRSVAPLRFVSSKGSFDSF